MDLVLALAMGAIALVLARSQIRDLLLSDAVQADIVEVGPQGTRLRWTIHGASHEALVRRRSGDTPGATVPLHVTSADPPRARRPSWAPATLTVALLLASLTLLVARFLPQG